MSCPFPLFILVALMTLPLLWFPSDFQVAPLSLVFQREAGAEGPAHIFMLIVLKGGTAWLWGLLSNHHINQSGKKSYCFHKDSARVEQQVLARHHPHTHTLQNLPSFIRKCGRDGSLECRGFPSQKGSLRSSSAKAQGNI